MSYGARFSLRLVKYAGSALLVAAGIVLSLADDNILRAIGILLLIFFTSYFLRINKPRRSLKKVSTKHGNIAAYLAPEAYRKLELAIDRTATNKSDFTLNLLSELINTAAVKKTLTTMVIAPAEFSAKVEDRRVRLARAQTKEGILKIISGLMLAGFAEAKVGEARSITSGHLLKALLKSELPEVVKTFEIFGHRPADMLHLL